MSTPRSSLLLLVDRGAAEHDRDRQAPEAAVSAEAVGDLAGEFAGRREHQHAASDRGAVRSAARGDRGRQREGCCLAGAGLGDADQIEAFEDGGMACIWIGVGWHSLPRQRLKDGLRQPEIFECHWVLTKCAAIALPEWRAGAAG